MVEQDKFVENVLTALTTNRGIRLQFGPETSTARQVWSLAVWEGVNPREVVMLAVEKLFEVMVVNIKGYYDEQRHNDQG